LLAAMFLMATVAYFFGGPWNWSSRDLPSQYDDPLYMAIASQDASEAGRIARKDPERLLKPLEDRGEGDLPLLMAVELGGRDVVEAMLKNGASPDVRGRGGRTALHCAAAAGDEALVRLLVENGADVSATDDVGFTPLFDAAQGGGSRAVAVAKVLVDAGADWSAATADGLTPLKIAERGSDFRMVSFLKQLSKSPKPLSKRKP